jgi:hypothetical protein
MFAVAVETNLARSSYRQIRQPTQRIPSMVYPHIQYEGPAHPDQLRPESPTGTRELDSRTSDGIHVRLLWHTEEERVSVAVEDTKTGESFELSVTDQERALDVFNHPYAYAAGQRFSESQPESTQASNTAAATGR